MPDESPDMPSVDDDDLVPNRPGASLRQRSSDIQGEHPIQVILAKVFGVHTQERAWRRGAIGEEEVARRLQKLGEGWHVIHSLPIGRNSADIDHLVIGPGGVFSLNTKNHLGKRVTVYDRAIYVNGVKPPYISKARAEGRRASTLLSAACGFEVAVMPIIVIIASELVIKGLPGDVAVVGRRRIAQWINQQPVRLRAERADAIFSAARHRQTWQKFS